MFVSTLTLHHQLAHDARLLRHIGSVKRKIGSLYRSQRSQDPVLYSIWVHNPSPSISKSTIHPLNSKQSIQANPTQPHLPLSTLLLFNSE